MADERLRIERRVRAAIERDGLFPAEGRLVVAVSGGADSLCLLGCLDALCGPGRVWPGVELVVAHLNHGLRGAAAQADAEWVTAFTNDLGWPCVVGARDVADRARRERRGIEDAARRERYAFLREVARDRGATLICVGHTRDDQAETVILHWLRGSGLSGMAGMRPLRDDIARPLLDLRRAQTHAYCALRGWTPRTDPSNDNRRFRRNRIRHELLPMLERYNPNLVNTLAHNATLLADDDACLEAAATSAWESVLQSAADDLIALDAHELARLPPALRRRILRRACLRLMVLPEDRPVEGRHIALLERLALAATAPAVPTDAGAVELPGNLRATRTDGSLLLRRLRVAQREASAHASPRANARSQTEAEAPLPVPGAAHLPGSKWRVRATLLDPAAGAVPPGSETVAPAVASVPAHRLRPATGTAADAGRAHMRAYVDADAAGAPLYVRHWHPGDRFQPLGMSGEKKVQDYFVDAHVPRAERTGIPLVWGPTHLIWVAGHRLDDRVKLTARTRRILALRLEPANPDDAASATSDAVLE